MENHSVIDDIAEDRDNSQEASEEQAGARGHKNRCRGGAAMHLPHAAVETILQMIVAGFSNAQMNHELHEQGHLAPEDTVSRQTFSRYRRHPRVKAGQEQRLDEALQAGHLLLSQSIVKAVETAKGLEPYVQLSPGVVFPHPNRRHLALYVNLQMMQWNFVWDKLGRRSLVKNSRHVQDDDGSKSEDLQRKRREAMQQIADDIRRDCLRILREASLRQQEETGEQTPLMQALEEALQITISS